MLEQVILLGVYTAAGFGMFWFSRHWGEYVGILFSPVWCGFLLFFLFPRYRKWAAVAFGLFGAYIVFKLSASLMDPDWFLYQGGTVAFVTICFMLVEGFWSRDLIAMRLVSSSARASVDQLRKEDRASVLEQRELESEVSEIVSLFELAREFNECIDLREMLDVLIRQVFNRISFEEGRLVFLDEDLALTEEQATAEVSATSRILASAGDEKIHRIIFDSWILKRLKDRPGTLRFDTSADDREGILFGMNIRYPLWIFPLTVGDKAVALFWVEGAKQEDFGKFEIIVSQLALHVKKVKLYNRVKELSIVDGLTKLFVRRHFLERFQEELARSIKYRLSLAVLLFDIDHFKRYNDTYGHLVGDVALRQVAQTIQEVIRRVDIAGRYGGEEFVVVLPETDRKGALDAAERIRSMVAKKVFRAYDEETRLTVSIGLTVFPDDIAGGSGDYSSEDLTSVLLRQADAALYRAKEEGRNQIVTFRKTQ